MSKQSGKKLKPYLLRICLKRIFWKFAGLYHRIAFIERKGYVEFGANFRFERSHPYKVLVGNDTITDSFNVWNAQNGDIIVGSNCWFGLNNIVMGPIHILNNVSTGPHVSFLGPRHAVLEKKINKDSFTLIGNNAWLSTGTIIGFGVNVGDNAIVGPGSVVNKDVPKGAFVAGNPARDLTKMASKLWGV